MTIQKLLYALLLCATYQYIAARPEPVTSTSLVIEGVNTHPVMALTPDAVIHGRENYQKHSWAKTIGDDITSSANVWMARDSDWIKKHMPGKAACFAYGFAGCPECGGRTAIWAAADCSFENPGHVKCSNGHSLPNDKFADTGTGYKGADGRFHYFVGCYNAWAIENFVTGAYDLAYAYSLTGEDKYATRCAEILDSLADIYPTCTIGSWDYPETTKGQNSGRFNRPQYQVGRVLITLADTYDQIFHCDALKEASVREGLTRRQNIENNMLLDGGWYCYEKSFAFSGLTNGSADYLKGAMVVGLVLGIPEFVSWPVDGPYGIKSMIANNIGRDGTYYETATGYSYYTRSIYRGYAEYLLNHRSTQYPNGVNLYEDQRFRDFMLLLNMKTQLGGGIPSYGDAAPVTGAFAQSEVPFDKYDFECLEYLRIRTKDPNLKQQYGRLQSWLSDGTPERYYTDSPSARWFLFQSEPLPNDASSNTENLTKQVTESNILGQKGLAVLRTGKGADSQGVMVRYGPALNHANLDDLNFTYHAFGRDLTYDLGYALASSHVYTGWSKQTASHQLVTVNEKSQIVPESPSGGSLKAFWDGQFTSGLDTSAPSGYQHLGVDEYARTLVLVSDPTGSPDTSSPAYLVDIFRVSGGAKHDSFTHSLGRDVKFGNATLGPLTSTSLAGKGMEWGDKILVDGDIDGHPNKPYWVGPPENGYGFLMEPQSIEPSGKSWWADWTLPDSQVHAKVWFPADANEKALNAWAPGILKNLPDARYVIRRREPKNGNSVFVSVWEPYVDKSSIVSVENLQWESVNSNWPAVGLKVTHDDGRIDIIYSSNDNKDRTIADVMTAGRLSRVSLKDDKCLAAEGVGLSKLVYKGQSQINEGPAGYLGALTKVDPAEGVVETSVPLRAGLELSDLVITFNNPKYSRSSAYKIKSVEQINGLSRIHLTEACVLGGGVVESVDATSNTISSLVSHEYMKPVRRAVSSGFFQGKQMIGNRGQHSNIVTNGLKQPLILTVDTVSDFKPGDDFIYSDVQVGDSFEILMPSTNRKL